MRKYKLATLSCFVFLSLNVLGQTDRLITGEYRGLTFVQFADSIEAHHPYRFYFDESETDSIQINIIAQNLTIHQLLDKALNQTGLHYAVDSLNRVFITKRFMVETSFPKDFCDKNTIERINGIMK